MSRNLALQSKTIFGIQLNNICLRTTLIYAFEQFLPGFGWILFFEGNVSSRQLGRSLVYKVCYTRFQGPFSFHQIKSVQKMVHLKILWPWLYISVKMNAAFASQDRLDAVDVPKAVEYVVNCMNFDGGFGCNPGSESHSGQVC